MSMKEKDAYNYSFIREEDLNKWVANYKYVFMLESEYLTYFFKLIL